MIKIVIFRRRDEGQGICGKVEEPEGSKMSEGSGKYEESEGSGKSEILSLIIVSFPNLQISKFSLPNSRIVEWSNGLIAELLNCLIAELKTLPATNYFLYR
jgi:hypothetical protein